MTDIGTFSIFLSVLVSIYTIIASLLGVKTNNDKLIKSAETSIFAITGLLSIAMTVLIYSFLTRDFEVAYVAYYSNKSLPFLYTISAVWAGQEGSLLLWAWLLSVFSTIVVVQNRKQNRILIPYVIAILIGVELFFTIMIAFVSSPFLLLDTIPLDGYGLNPMLQNPGMIIHPPLLFLGYVGFTVPFAFAGAALITGQLKDIWIRSTRRWTIISWFFLGAGILIGAQWAYVELGWGGYWAWDPVENASLMPWLIATAYLHSVMIQERRNMLKIWNILLIIFTFLFCIFGTFITRSGIISSVHAFGQSSLGSIFLFLIVIVFLGSMIFLIKRWHLLKSTNAIDSLVCRESSFLFNNLILVGAAFSIFWGTIFPLISEAIRGVKITVGPPFFNQVIIPIGLALLFLTGICPLIAWHKATGKNFRRNLLVPLIITVLSSIGLLIAGIDFGYPWISFTLCIFVLVTISLEFIKGVRARHRMTSENYFVSFGKLMWKNKRRYGGYIVHIGIVLIFLGITGSSAFKIERQVYLFRGDSIEILDYKITYEGLAQYPTENKEVISATLSIFENNKKIGSLNPAIENYKYINEQTVSEVAIRSSLKEDLYVILIGYETNGSAASFKIVINPLIAWIWLGGIVIFFGTLFVLLPDKREKNRLRIKYTREATKNEV